MAEETLINKVTSAVTNMGYTYTADQLDSLIADSIRYISQYLPKLDRDTSNSGDGSTKAFSLNTSFIDLWIDEERTYTGVQSYTASSTSKPSPSDDIYSTCFEIDYASPKTITFDTAPESGSTIRISYKGFWATDGSDLPSEYERAVVFLSQHYVVSQSQAFGGDIDEIREGSVSRRYKSSDTSEGGAKMYLNLANAEIRSIMNSQNASLIYGTLRSRRG